MNYLFFDIECASTHENKAKIYSVGYVLTNKHFTILKSEDLLINPNCVWDNYVKNKILKYDIQKFDHLPTFNRKYKTLAKLFSKKKNVCIGFAANNDIKFLKQECERYNKKMFDFKVFDVQKVFKQISKMKNLTSLKNALSIVGNQVQVNFHNSQIDAEATKILLQSLCIKQKMMLEEFLQVYSNCRILTKPIIKSKKCYDLHKKSGFKQKNELINR